MADPSTFLATRNPRPFGKELRREDGPKIEYRIRKLERICRKLEEKPSLHAGVSSQEVLEILKKEQQRLVTALRS